VSSPRPPQHPACGSARGVSFEIESTAMRPCAPKLVTTTYRRHRPQVHTVNGDVEIGAAPLCRRFGPSPCPTHYGGRLANMPAADFCSITLGVAAARAARACLRVRWVSQSFRRGPQSGSRSALRPHVEQISPNKNMSCRCTTAAFTLSLVPGGFCHEWLTHPETGPSIRFLFVGSHLCARASFRPALAGSPLPSASSYRYIGFSYTALSPHKLMPMSGVHLCVQRTRVKQGRALPASCPRAADAGRWAAQDADVECNHSVNRDVWTPS